MQPQALVAMPDHTKSPSRQLRFTSYLGVLAVMMSLVAVLLPAASGTAPTGWQRATAWSLLAIALVAGVRRLGARLCGPVFFCEVVRTARTGWLHLPRAAFALLLLLFLWLAFREWQETVPWDAQRTPNSGYEAQLVSRIAERCLHRFVYVHLVAVLLLTPACLVGAIAAERDRRHLESLFVTDLGRFEIVLGKLFAGLGRIGLTLLAGLPVLAFLQLLGGPELGLVLVGYTVIALTLLSLGSLSVLFSVYSRKPRNALVLTYLLPFAVLVVTYVVQRLVPPPAWWKHPAGRDAFLAIRRSEFPHALEVFCRSNPIVTWMHIQEVWDANSSLTEQLSGTLLPYALVHGLATLVCTTWAVFRLRAAAEAPAGSVKPRPSLQAWRPDPGRWPLLWREVFLDQDRRFGKVGRAVCLLLLLLCLTPVLRMAWQAVVRPGGAGSNAYPSEVAWLLADLWCRILAMALAGLTLVGVAIHAASGFSGESERRTLDLLLITPVGPGNLLWCKWLGSILSARRYWLWLLALWGASMACGGPHGRVLLGFVGAWLVYAGCFAMIGLWFSMHCANTQRATLWTLATVASLSLGHWLSWFFLDRARDRPRPSFPASIQVFGLTPPAALGWIALRGEAVFLAEGEEYRGDVRILRWGDFLDLTRSGELAGSPLRSSGFTVDRSALAAALWGLGIGGGFWVGLTALAGYGTLRRLRLLRGEGHTREPAGARLKKVLDPLWPVPSLSLSARYSRR